MVVTLAPGADRRRQQPEEYERRVVAFVDQWLSCRAAT